MLCIKKFYSVLFFKKIRCKQSEQNNPVFSHIFRIIILECSFPADKNTTFFRDFTFRSNSSTKCLYSKNWIKFEMTEVLSTVLWHYICWWDRRLLSVTKGKLSSSDDDCRTSLTLQVKRIFCCQNKRRSKIKRIKNTDKTNFNINDKILTKFLKNDKICWQKFLINHCLIVTK